MRRANRRQLLVSIAFAVLQMTVQQQRSIDGSRFTAALAAYVRDLQIRGDPVPSSVTLKLDQKVGPFHYGQMSIDELCQKLRSDHRVLVRADRETGTRMMANFGTDRSMSRRAVLEKLTRESDCDLCIGYCGTGATFPFWSSPQLHDIASQDGPTSSSDEREPAVYLTD